MTVAERYPARAKYRCDICGAEDFWQPTWNRMSSVAHDEACPDDVPTVCGDKCKAELEKRLADGRIRLPKLQVTPGYFKVVRPRHGY